MNLLWLDAWDPESGTLNVIIETPKGGRNKLRYNPGQQLFELSKVLPSGTIFPFDFGFIPSTLAEDGDPLDVLVLLEEPVPTGCKVPARLVGVLEAEQTEDGRTERNDRLLAVAEDSHEHREVHSVKDLNQWLLEEVEHFFVSYNEMPSKEFKSLGWHGPHTAEKLVKEAAQRFRKEHKGGQGEAESNGKKKTTRNAKARPPS